MAQSETAEAAAGAHSSGAATESTAATAGKGKGKQPEQAEAQKRDSKPVAQQQTDADTKLSGKELKARKQAEKQARRAAEKSGGDGGHSGEAPTVNGHAGPSRQEGSQAQGEAQMKQKQGAQQQQTPATDSRTQHRRTGSQSQATRPLPLRRRPSQTGTKEPRKVNKEVGLFGHLYSQPRRSTMDGVSKDVHPAVLALGFQMSNYVICGSNARCVAMLLAFKKVWQTLALKVSCYGS